MYLLIQIENINKDPVSISENVCFLLVEIMFLVLQIRGWREVIGDEKILMSNDFFGTLLFFKRFYLFIFRERGREGEREGEEHQWVASCTPHNSGPNLQSRLVSWLGIEPVPFLFVGWCLTTWATPIRAMFHIFWEYIQ